MPSAIARRARLPDGASSFTAALMMAAAICAGCAGRSQSSAHAASTASRPSVPPVCRPAARSAIASTAAVGVGSVGAAAGVGNNGQPECRFSFAAASPAARRARVVANLDGAPQAYFRLERTIVETAQLFRADRTFPAPEQVPGIGLDASWFPTDSQLMTTDGHTLITVGVHWPGVTQRRVRAMAAAVAKLYLGPLDRKAADPPGTS